MNTSYETHKERCPECAKLGKDRNGDNLGVYSDGHKYCYSCGYGEYADGMTSFVNRQQDSDVAKIQQREILTLPVDCDILYPERALTWIKKYELSKTDLLNNNVMWSESIQRLIFPVYGEDGWLLAWQGRSFHNQSMALAKIPKWFGKGDLKNTFNILGKGSKLVLTEDIVSAIKVAKAGFQAMPLYGCVVGRERFKRLYSLYKDTIDVVVWLDENKMPEAIREAKLGRTCGLHCSSVFSYRDPKDESVENIKSILGD